jgi:hypothetical protein
MREQTSMVKKAKGKKIQAKPSPKRVAAAQTAVYGTCTVTSAAGITTTNDNYTEAACQAMAHAVDGKYKFVPYRRK